MSVSVDKARVFSRRSSCNRCAKTNQLLLSAADKASDHRGKRQHITITLTTGKLFRNFTCQERRRLIEDMPNSPSSHIVVMGVTGSGKSTLGCALAAECALPFVEGDALHSTEAVAKMRSGLALSDNDRWPWLDRIAATLAQHPSAVAACSALRRSYRDRLRQTLPDLWFVLPIISESLAAGRVADRTGHFMPAGLVASQFGTLEEPRDEPNVVTLPGDLPTEQQVAMLRAVLKC
jgi:gluconokinase